MNWPNELNSQSRPANWFNQILRRCRRGEIVSVVGGALRETSHGKTLEIFQTPGGGDPGVMKQFRLKQIHDDYLTCREFDGITESLTDVLIAKPFELRKTGWDGQTIVYPAIPYPGNPGSVSVTYAYQVLPIGSIYRTASVTGFTQHEVIDPPYLINKSVIFASQSANGTGVSNCDWIELSARAWARAS